MMSGDMLATLVNIGIGGAVIAVVIVYLKFIEKRDADWRNFFTAIRQADGEASRQLAEVINKLVNRIESLEDRFIKHDASEMEILRKIVDRKQKEEP